MYKNPVVYTQLIEGIPVSILVLMDLCIKTTTGKTRKIAGNSFNPCFNGSMYKNDRIEYAKHIQELVSILVLMDLCIKTKFHPH